VQPRRVIAFDAATGAQQARVARPRPEHVRLMPGAGSVVASLTDDSAGLWAWDVETGRTTLAPFPGWPDGAPVRSFDVAPDGNTIAIADRSTGAVSLIDVESGAARARIARPGFELGLLHVKFSPDGKVLLLFTNRSVILWDVAAGAERAEAAQPIGFTAAFALNPVLPVFVGTNFGKYLALFSLATGRVLREFDLQLGQRIWCAGFSPDGLTCAVGGSNWQFAVFDVDL